MFVSEQLCVPAYMLCVCVCRCACIWVCLLVSTCIYCVCMPAQCVSIQTSRIHKYKLYNYVGETSRMLNSYRTEVITKLGWGYNGVTDWQGCTKFVRRNHVLWKQIIWSAQRMYPHIYMIRRNIEIAVTEKIVLATWLRLSPVSNILLSKQTNNIHKH